jgi:hypothetical protein
MVHLRIVVPEFGPIAGLCVAAVEKRRALARRSLAPPPIRAVQFLGPWP